VVGCCEQGNETKSRIREWEFLAQEERILASPEVLGSTENVAFG
jgi:hypothetical protein